jgi:IS30 family transposase
MEQKKNNTKRPKYEHVKERERYQLEVLMRKRLRVSEIAVLLRRHRSTIYREQRKGSVKLLGYELEEKEQYRAEVAQRETEERGRERERGLKIGRDRELEKYIRERIEMQRHSPDAILGGIRQQKLEFERMICTKTLYNYINQGVFAGIGQEQLWEKGRRSRRRRWGVKAKISLNNRLGRSIEERSEKINQREEYGHWEGDTVKGGQGTLSVLLTLTERRSREECILKLDQGTQEAVKAAFDRLEKEQGDSFKRKFKSVTVDNGSEFLNAEAIEKSCWDQKRQRTRVYFAHPNSAWERGTNENHNRMIRRFIPKGRDIGVYSEEVIAGIQEWMNNYPRKILGYLTPNQVAAAHLAGNG